MSFWRELRTLFYRNAPTIGPAPNLPALQYSLRMVDEDTLEVQRFHNGWLRLGAWFCFFLMMFFVVLSWWEQNNLWWRVQILLDAQSTFEKSFEHAQELSPPSVFSGQLSQRVYLREHGAIRQPLDRRCDLCGPADILLYCCLHLAALSPDPIQPHTRDRLHLVLGTLLLGRANKSLGLGRGMGDFELMLTPLGVPQGVGHSQTTQHWRADLAAAPSPLDAVQRKLGARGVPSGLQASKQ